MIYLRLFFLLYLTLRNTPNLNSTYLNYSYQLWVERSALTCIRKQTTAALFYANKKLFLNFIKKRVIIWFYLHFCCNVLLCIELIIGVEIINAHKRACLYYSQINFFYRFIIIQERIVRLFCFVCAFRIA